MTHQHVMHSQTEAIERVTAKNDAQAFWDVILAELKLQMTRYTYVTWLQQTRGIRLTATELTIQVPNAYVKDWLENRLRRRIQRTIAYHAGRPVNVRFVTLREL